MVAHTIPPILREADVAKTWTTRTTKEDAVFKKTTKQTAYSESPRAPLLKSFFLFLIVAVLGIEPRVFALSYILSPFCIYKC